MRVHLIAACGVGMSALAGLLRAAGHSVTGSDEHVYPPASTLLEELGIPVFHGYDSAYFDKEAKFLHYRPAMLLLNAIEFDHADIYRDLEHVKSAFRKLLGILPAGAPLIACGDFPHVLDVIRGTHARVRRFGLGEANDWRITDLTDDGATRFTVREGGRAVCRLV